ncbi:MAG: hypothetical protein KC619_27845 [Myxococcales bacterium]|nr:hypothetical protein [Myxococcales bacterium]
MLRYSAHSLLTCSLVLAAGILGCDPPPDETPGEGSSVESSGLIHGAVLYAGPRPNCRYEGEVPTEVVGNAVLLMFFSDNPPPPAGSATSASNVLVVPAREFFGLEDCLSANPTAEELSVVVTRNVGFDWPEITLAQRTPDASGSLGCRAPFREDGEGRCIADYQIRGFMDRDGDWNPFFSVTRLATRGDVAGGAFENSSVAIPQFAHLVFGSVDDFPNGQVLDGVAITLGAPVNTELPAFELGAMTRAGRSEDLVPAVSDAVMREEMIWNQTNMQLRLIDPTSDSWTNTLGAAGLSINPDPSGFAWFTPEVDSDRDGIQDLHPILGSGGVLWEHPIVILRRARNPIELAAGIPDAVVIATVRPSQTGAKDTFYPVIDIGVAPVAAVNTNAAAECLVPYLAPGSLAENLERIPVDCQELPTGNYDINVLSGIAGGRAIDYRQQLRDDGTPEMLIDMIVRTRTDNDWVIEGGQFSSQAWSVPNELGCPDPYRPNGFDADGRPTTFNQLEEDPTIGCGEPASCDASGTHMQCSQGPAGRWSLVDPDGGNAPDASSTADGHGVAACQTAIRASTMMPDTVHYMELPDECCPPSIQGLCGLPLCPLRPTAILAASGGARDVREMVEPGVDYRVEADGSITPLCVPFLPPVSCCRGR